MSIDQLNSFKDRIDSDSTVHMRCMRWEKGPVNELNSGNIVNEQDIGSIEK